MDIEAIVKKHYDPYVTSPTEQRLCIRAALTELAAEYEQKQALLLDAHCERVSSLQERIRQLDAERVPDGIVVSSEWLRRIHRDLDACQKVIWLGMRDADPSYCADAKARLKEIDAMLAAAPQPKKEGE